MGWLGDQLARVAGQTTEDMLFFEDLQASDIKPADWATPDNCYLELVVESLRIEKARVFGTNFHGVVYCYLTMSRQAEESATLAAVTKPAHLSNLAPSSIGTVISRSRKMVGAIPWRGDRISVELGLFSVKSGTVLNGLIDFITEMSSVAGSSVVGCVKPFLPLFSKGMAILSGQTSDTRLEVGLDTNLEAGFPRTYAIVAAPKGTISREKISLDPADHKLLYEGRPLSASYCVFTVLPTDRKTDFGEIPQLRETFADFRKPLMAGNASAARAALAVFRRAALLSPDLIESDAERLVELAEQKMLKALAPPRDERTPADIGKVKFGGGVSLAQSAEEFPGSLAEIGLYS